MAWAALQSVKASKEEIKISSQVLQLQEFSFSRQQIVELIKSILIPLTLELKEEIELLKKNSICYNNQWSIYCTDDKSSRYLDFYKMGKLFGPLHESRKDNLSAIRRREEVYPVIDGLEKRQERFDECAAQLANVQSTILKHERQIYAIFDKRRDIGIHNHYDDFGNLMGESEYLEFRDDEYQPIVIFLTNLKDLIVSLIIYELFNPILKNDTRFPSEILSYYFNVKGLVYNESLMPAINKYKDTIIWDVKELLNQDLELLRLVESTVLECRKEYGIASDEIK